MAIFSKMLLPAFLSLDPALGRINLDAIPDQARMELFFSQITPQSTIQDESGEFLDVCQWPSVECDENQNVTVFNSVGRFHKISGALQFEYLAPKVHRIVIIAQEILFGTLQTSQLPELLTYLHIEATKMSGPFNMATLPQHLIKCLIGGNSFSGTCDLSALPGGLKDLSASGNRFSGSIDLTKLPVGLEILGLSRNNFEGELDFSCLPNRLRQFALVRNHFSGTVVIKKLPQRLESLLLSRNAFVGTAVIPSNALLVRLDKQMLSKHTRLELFVAD